MNGRQHKLKGNRTAGDRDLVEVLHELLGTPMARDWKGVPGDRNQLKSLPRDIKLLPEGSWGRYEPAIRMWERITGREPPVPLIPGLRGRKLPRLNPEFSEWMMGLPAGWVTGIELSYPSQLQILGNGVVPQAAVIALRILLDETDVP